MPAKTGSCAAISAVFMQTKKAALGVHSLVLPALRLIAYRRGPFLWIVEMAGPGVQDHSRLPEQRRFPLALCYVAGGANYDRLLSGHVGYARSANAIDETRADFDRVGWGSAGTIRPRVGQEPEPLIQIWFAGNHSDVGGSYPEVESRLSDAALMWMTEQAVGIPDGLKIGPVIVNGNKMRRTGDVGESLSLFPSCDGVQHCEITAMQDAIDHRTPRSLRRLTSYLNWKEKIREIKHDALVHDTFKQRFALPSVVQCASSGSHRPPALANHQEFKAFYPRLVEESTSAAPVGA